MWRRDRRLSIFLVAAIAFAAKLLLALRTYGTNDVYTFERFGFWSRYFGADLYRIDPDLNHPPSMLHVLRFLLWMSEHTSLPFHFWMRFPGILADLGTLWLVCKILGQRLAERSVFIPVLLIALAPTHILISGFHGNTDPVMIFFVMAAVWLAGYRGNPAAGGVAFGMALCVKVAPVILAPVLFLFLAGARKRMAFFAATAAVIAIAWSPYAFQEPAAVIRQVLGYKSSYGLWGFSYLLRELANASVVFEPVNRAFSRFGALLLVAAILALSIGMNRLPRRPSLYTQAGMVFLVFFTATSGFAVQYLAWLTPWVAELGAIPVGLFVITGSFFLLVVYNYWTLGMPWYLAIAYPWSNHQYFQVLCWLSVLLLTFAAWRRIRGKSLPAFPFRGAPAKISPVVRLSAATGCIAVFLIVPAIVHMRRDTFAWLPAYDGDAVLYTRASEYHELAAELWRRGRDQEGNAVEMQASTLDGDAQRFSDEHLQSQPSRMTPRTPEDFMDASQDDFERREFARCISDATESLRFRPDMPTAWSNISICSAQLGDWDNAVAAAMQALRIEPESEVIRHELDAALDGQRHAARPRKQ